MRQGGRAPTSRDELQHTAVRRVRRQEIATLRRHWRMAPAAENLRQAVQIFDGDALHRHPGPGMVRQLEGPIACLERRRRQEGEPAAAGLDLEAALALAQRRGTEDPGVGWGQGAPGGRWRP